VTAPRSVLLATPLAGLLLAGLLLAGLLFGCAAPAPAPTRPLAFGVLGASCEPGRAAALRGVGITTAVLDVGWDRFEPIPGSYDPGYVDELRRRIATCRDAGLSVVLGLGLQYPPSWVSGLSGATLAGPSGATPSTGRIDLVFSDSVRSAVANYLGALAREVGFADVAAVRLGTNGTGELGYPGPADGGDSYWAFGPAPQQGTGMAPGMARTPLPGWRPGEPQWNGRPVTGADVSAWFDWYTRALVDAVGWQAGTLRGLGFEGRFQIPVAGRGVLPAELSDALAGRLDGSGDPTGALGRGLHYTMQFPLLAELDRRLPGGIDVAFTGIDDDTAVRARAELPPQDTCRLDDVDELLTRRGTEHWSGQRWTIANARRVGLPVIGENPGPPGLPHTGGSPWSDSSAEQLHRVVGYARDCGLTTFSWAFENELFTPGSGVDLHGFGRELAAAGPAS
jgi:hypothetical protein